MPNGDDKKPVPVQKEAPIAGPKGAPVSEPTSRILLDEARGVFDRGLSKSVIVRPPRPSRKAGQTPKSFSAKVTDYLRARDMQKDFGAHDNSLGEKAGEYRARKWVKDTFVPTNYGPGLGLPLEFDTRRGTKGPQVLDLLFELRDGRFLVFEVKFHTSKLKEDQFSAGWFKKRLVEIYRTYPQLADRLWTAWRAKQIEAVHFTAPRDADTPLQAKNTRSVTRAWNKYMQRLVREGRDAPPWTSTPRKKAANKKAAGPKKDSRKRPDPKKATKAKQPTDKKVVANQPTGRQTATKAKTTSNNPVEARAVERRSTVESRGTEVPKSAARPYRSLPSLGPSKVQKPIDPGGSLANQRKRNRLSNLQGGALMIYGALLGRLGKQARAAADAAVQSRMGEIDQWRHVGEYVVVTVTYAEPITKDIFNLEPDSYQIYWGTDVLHSQPIITPRGEEERLDRLVELMKKNKLGYRARREGDSQRRKIPPGRHLIAYDYAVYLPLAVGDAPSLPAMAFGREPPPVFPESVDVRGTHVSKRCTKW